MTNPVLVSRLVHDGDLRYSHHLTWCPGCDQMHPFRTAIEGEDHGDRPVWDFDGNMEAPTFNPSLLVYGTVHLCEEDIHYEVCPDVDACKQKGHYLSPEGAAHVLPCPEGSPGKGNCHSFLVAGVWQFLFDSAHALAGKNVPMVPLPNYLVGD